MVATSASGLAPLTCTMDNPYHVVAANFDTQVALQDTVEYIALCESLFGLSDLSPLSSPEPTPPPSLLLCTAMELKARDSNGDHDNNDNDNENNACTPNTQGWGPLLQLSVLPTSILTPSTLKKAKKRAKNHLNCRGRCERDREENFANIQSRPNRDSKIISSSTPIICQTDASMASRVGTGYTGRNDEGRSTSLFTLNELVGKGSKWGFRLQQWDGK